MPRRKKKQHRPSLHSSKRIWIPWRARSWSWRVIGELNAQYDELTSAISDLSIQAAEKEEELKSLEEKLQEAKQISDKQYEDMKKRIVYMYEHGSASMLELLLSSEDLAQFLNRAGEYCTDFQY